MTNKKVRFQCTMHDTLQPLCHIWLTSDTYNFKSWYSIVYLMILEANYIQSAYSKPRHFEM